MPFNKDGLWVEPAAYWASPEGQAEQRRIQEGAQSAMSAEGQAGIISPTGWTGDMSEGGGGLTYVAPPPAPSEDLDQYQGYASQHIQANSPQWQAALNAYNTGQPVPKEFRSTIQHLAAYHEQGQAAPGKLTTEMANASLAQWNVDAPASSALSRFGEWAVPLGLTAAVGAAGGALLSGTGGTAAGAGAGGTAAAGSTAAMTPEAYAAGTAAGYGTTGTAASAGLGTLAAPAATAVPAAGMIGTGSTTAADATLGGVGASTGGAGTSNTLGSLAAGSTIANTVANSGGDSTSSSGDGGFWDSAGNWVSNNSSGLGALLQGGTSLWAGQQGVDAANKATDELRRQFDIGQTNAAPWLEAGKNALGAQQDLMGLGANGPEAQLSSLMQSPGYQFRLNQGRRNLEASSAARGGMGSGKAGTAMTNYGQDYASNEYGNRLNQLAGVSGTGQTQANQNMNAGMNYAGEMGNASLMGAQSRQSGILGAGSALSNWMNPQPKQMTLADLLRSK